jgi:hypothetical protein
MKRIRILDHRVVAIARQVPHHDLVALADALAANLDIAHRGATHVRQRRLVSG